MPRGRKSSWPPGPERAVFTTGEVAKLCHVTAKTVIRWIDAGQLKAFKIPNSRDRRVERVALIAFMREHELPLAGLDGNAGRRRILVVDDEAEIRTTLKQFLDALGLFDIETASNGYEAGTKTMSFKPHLLIVDYNLGDVTGADVARTVRANPQLGNVKIVCMSGFLTQEQGAALVSHGVDDFVRKPIDLKDLRQRIFSLLALV
jgi:excisionase family DNA binding protein